MIICLLFIAVPATFSQQTDPTTKLLAEQFIEQNDHFRAAQDLSDRLQFLLYLAPAAYNAGRNDQAKQYADELLLTVKAVEREKRKLPHQIGRANHVSNTVLGLIAIEGGRTSEAANYLLASGRVTGNPPVLLSFGPNMLLAKRLLEKGDRATVIEYFDLCANFWKDGSVQLERWKKAVQQGEMPDFHFNLSYEIDDWRFAK